MSQTDEKNEGCCCGHNHEHAHEGHECCGGHGHAHGEGCGCGHHHGGADPDRDRIGVFIVGPLDTNCYAYISKGECLVVDPGASGQKLYDHLPEGVTVKYIVATHGHGDHVGGVAALKRACGAPYAIHAADAELARHAGEPSELGRTYDENAPDPDLTLAEGDVLEVGSARFRVMETPGHTPGCVCLLGEGTARHVAFMGDTLFKNSCGRTDLAGGDPEVMKASLARIRETIHPHTNLFCGHGDVTTMEDELAQNPTLAL